MTYMQFTCKNSKLPIKYDSHGRVISKHPDYCDRAFLDVEPFPGCMSVQTWKYCDDCVKKGFKNPDKKPVSENKQNQMNKMREAKRLKN